MPATSERPKIYARAIHVRDFLRGGYQTISEETIVTKHGRAIGKWIPMGIPIAPLVDPDEEIVWTENDSWGKVGFRNKKTGVVRLQTRPPIGEKL